MSLSSDLPIAFILWVSSHFHITLPRDPYILWNSFQEQLPTKKVCAPRAKKVIKEVEINEQEPKEPKEQEESKEVIPTKKARTPRAKKNVDKVQEPQPKTNQKIPETKEKKPRKKALKNAEKNLDEEGDEIPILEQVDKPKRKYNKKKIAEEEKITEVIVPTEIISPNEDEDEYDELQLQDVYINDVLYYVDSEDRLYHRDTLQIFGKLSDFE
jgi:hypothetical protein